MSRLIVRRYEVSQIFRTVYLEGRGGWSVAWVDNVPMSRDDSDLFIVCKAMVMSGSDWRWPWWRRTANRKLAYLKKNGVK